MKSNFLQIIQRTEENFISWKKVAFSSYSRNCLSDLLLNTYNSEKHHNILTENRATAVWLSE